MRKKVFKTYRQNSICFHDVVLIENHNIVLAPDYKLLSSGRESLSRHKKAVMFVYATLASIVHHQQVYSSLDATIKK